MVIRRIREHVKSHNWFSVSVDVAIVVVGVFLGTQANNWNNARIERSESAAYRARYLDELDYNRQQIAQQMRYYAEVQRHAQAALEALDTPARSLGTTFLVNAYQGTQIDTTRPKRFIFNEMLNAGMLDRLGSGVLQEQSSDYNRTLDAMDVALFEKQPFRDLVRSQMPWDMQKLIATTCGDKDVFWNGRLIGLTLPPSCTPALEPQLAEKVATKLVASPGFAGELTRTVAALQQKIGTLRYGLTETDKLRTSMRCASSSADGSGRLAPGVDCP